MSNQEFLHKNLTGKTIVFTGGTDGMGKIAVMKLAKMGATIMLLGRSPQKTMAVVDELNVIAKKENAFYVPCDLTSQTASERLRIRCSINAARLIY